MHSLPISDTSILHTEARPSIYKCTDMHGKKYNRMQYSHFAASVVAVQPQDVVSGDARFLSEVPTIFHISAHVSTLVINIRLLNMCPQGNKNHPKNVT